jgi:hypothetical protein
MDNEHRKVANRLLAKALAYKDCGKQREANEHAAALVFFLSQIGINMPESLATDNLEEQSEVAREQ